jgi:hypothetical protein
MEDLDVISFINILKLIANVSWRNRLEEVKWTNLAPDNIQW